MADASLDDIIKQKRLQRFGNVNQNNAGKKNFNKGKGSMANKGRLFKDVQKDLGIITRKHMSLTTDARNRIIQKQRGKFRDARDRLAQLAKQGDARDKLNRIRKNPTQIRKLNRMVPNKAIVQQKPAVVKKQIINVPKQTLKTGQTRMKGNDLVRTVAGGGIKKKIVTNIKQPIVVKKVIQQTNQSKRVGQHQKTGRPQFVVKNQFAMRGRNINQHYDAQFADVTDFSSQPYNTGAAGMGTVLMTRQEPLFRTRPVQTIVYEEDYEPEIRPSRMRITAPNFNYRIAHQAQVQPQTWNPPRIQHERAFDEQVEYQVYPKKVSAVPSARPPITRGTKVVVSNLHPKVTMEDMEELLGTVGPLSYVGMVRPGVAEAVFLNDEDAYRSVDQFNNRQLDGQAMKVVVVKSKTPLITAGGSQGRSVLKSARGRSGYYM
ncbi:polymerase delta-interacting protein 3 [Halocaridina rubra]|uniref:Polymerase delta-interacting protein 3 n=1 Tax=Halocaridina rubra TaxID=373956 RepID=A0AAN9ADE6_HALRR